MKAKKTRTLIRFLRVGLGLCVSETRRFAGMTPAKAWAKATPDERYNVMNGAGWKHSRLTCPACTASAPANKKLPAFVLNEFRKWQRAKS